MKTTSIFKFIVTMVMVMVMVIFSTTINAQSAQINSTTDFSDYDFSVSHPSLINIVQNPNGFEFPGQISRSGFLKKGYNFQTLDSVKVTFKITASYSSGGSADFRVSTKVNSASLYFDKDYDMQPEGINVYTYSKTFVGPVLFDTMFIKFSCYDVNHAYSGTITVDSLVITGYSQSGSIWTESGTVGIEENVDNVTNFNTYPNPNSGQFKVAFETKSLSTPVMVYDIQGRLVYEDKEDREIGMNTINIDMFNVSSGVYFVKVKNEVFKMQVIK